MSPSDAVSGSRARRSVASRARFYLAGVALIALSVAFAVFSIGWSQYSIAAHTDELSRQVSALAKGQAAASRFDTATADARDALFRVEAGLMGAQLFIAGKDGAVLRSSADSPPPSLPLDRLAALGTNGTRSGVLRNAAGRRVLVVAASVDATRSLVAVQDLAEIRRVQMGLLVLGAMSVLVAALVAYVAGGALARRFTRPLVRLRDAAEQVADGAFGTQVPKEGDAETASLADSFNRMSSRVADSYAAQRAFAGDVSHEIRTPLTSIRGFAEAMLDGTVSDPAGQERALTVIRDEATRISEVSATLLALSELDAGAVEIAREPVDNAALGDALRGRFSAAAQEAGVSLEVDLLGDAKAVGDSDRVLQALSALVANALAHTPDGGRVRVSATRAGASVLLRVDDSGPGIPPERREEIFGRFARLDSSRSTRTGGAGLGLAICRRLVELMGGDVRADESDLGGARFEIELPAA